MMKNKFKKIVKGLLTFALVMSALVGLNSNVVYAAGRSDSYNLYYNSPGNTANKTSATCQVTYYAGTMCFAVDSLSGSLASKAVSCAGLNVTLSTTLLRTSTGIKNFTCKLTKTSYTTANFNVKIVRGDNDTATEYASGRIYY